MSTHTPDTNAGDRPGPTSGRFTTYRFDDITLHDYEAPEDSFLVHSTLVEGPSALVLFDAQLLLPYAAEVADHVQSLGKPLERIIVSHGHVDHWAGLQLLLERFPETPVYALPAVAAHLRQNAQQMLDLRRDAPYGPRLATRAVVPEHDLREGTEVIDGVEYEFTAFDNGESEHQIVVRMPHQRVLLGFDLVGSHQDHYFVVRPFFDSWIQILRALADMPFETLLTGHAGSVARADIDATIDYVRQAKEVYASTNDPATFAARMKDRFPARGHSRWIDFSPVRLYGLLAP